MRKSLSEFIDTCFDVKVHLGISSYEIHDSLDGDYADFLVNKITDPKALLNKVGDHVCRIIADDGFMRVRVFENFKD